MAIIGILLIMLGVLAWRMKGKLGYPLGNRLGLVQIGAPVLGVLLFVASMAYVVKPGYAGVVVLFGSVKPYAMSSGLHFINPFSSVEEMEIRTRNYTMSSVADEGQKRGDDSIPVITSDGLTLKLDATMFYHLEQEFCPQIFSRIGSDVEGQILRGQVRTSLRDAAASMTATELYTSKRQIFVNTVTQTLAAAFKARGIVLEQVLLRNVILPDQITKAINDKIAADQEAQKMTFVLLKEKQEAERKRIEAEGQARAQQIVSASLTPQIIEYQRIQALREIGAKGNMIITPMGGATPIINLPAKK